MLIDTYNHHWAEGRFGSIEPGRPALFLDRDGVVVEEVNYLSRVADVRLTPDVGAAVAAANRAGVSVIVVTNQSGIGRGMYGWDEFVRINDEIARQLQSDEAHIDAILACGAHPDGPFAADPWRKPAGGMILHAERRIAPDLSRSFIVGDRISDLMAGANGGLAGGWLVESGHGKGEMANPEMASLTLRSHVFAARTAKNAATAISSFLDIVAR